MLVGATNNRDALQHSEVVFMYAADDEAYKAYQTTFVAWGGAHTQEQVKRHHELGIRCTGSMWCLTAGAKLIHEDPTIRSACAIDIEGKPIPVPWLFDHTHEGTPSYFGCTNHPAFQELCRQRVKEAMAGGADGLHVDDHLGTASPAWWHGGGFCDHCMEGFREYLKVHASQEELQQAGVDSLDDFDYRNLVKKHASTREDFKKVQSKIPLYSLFRLFHVEAASEHTRSLGAIAAEAAGHPVLLSANACIPSEPHIHVLKNLTHVVCEVNQNAWSGTRDIAHAIEAYALAASMGKPLAATASGWDWAYVYDHHCEELVRFWIALAYAHGQRFMVPHPKKQWCFNQERGTHWYEAPIESYAPVYRFIRNHADCFDGYESIQECELTCQENILVTARQGHGSALVLHCVNLDYDIETKTMRPQENVSLKLKRFKAQPYPSTARILSYDSDMIQIPVQEEGQILDIILPELRLWSLICLP